MTLAEQADRLEEQWYASPCPPPLDDDVELADDLAKLVALVRDGLGE